MALVGYDSSDDQDEVQPQPTVKSSKPSQEATVESNGDSNAGVEPVVGAPSKTDPEKPELIGPMPMPQDSENPSFLPLEEDAPMDDEGPALPTGSPYTATRALLRDLTLPTVPNMDIPPSPPGSPPRGTNKKFEQFLELKKKGTHFNSKIAQSSALKNPGLMDKLLNFVEIDQNDQYKTTLGTDLWDPSSFPRWAYKEQLRQSQKDIGETKARSRGAPVEFVPAYGGGSQTITPGQQASTESSSAAPALNTGRRKTRCDT